MTKTEILAIIAANLDRYPVDEQGHALGRSKWNEWKWAAYYAFIMDRCGNVCVVCGDAAACEVGHLISAGGGRKGFDPVNNAGMCRLCNLAIGDTNQAANIATWANVEGIALANSEFVPAEWRQAGEATEGKAAVEAHRLSLAAKGIRV